MAEQKVKAMSQQERDKLLADVKGKGVLNKEEREELAQKLDADFDVFLKNQMKSSTTSNTSRTPATEEDIDKLAEVNL